MHPSPILQRSIRRLALTTKQGPHTFYKGNRTGAMGRHTKYGGYVIDWKKVRTYVRPPGLDGFHLTPFVARTIEEDDPYEVHPDFRFRDALTAKSYLQLWKEDEGRCDTEALAK